jgi:hypothetical protein
MKDVPESFATTHGESNHAGYGAHQLINRVELGGKTASLFVGIGIAIGLGVFAVILAYFGEREGRLAQFNLDTFTKEQYYAWNPQVENHFKDIDRQLADMDTRLNIRQECRR